MALFRRGAPPRLIAQVGSADRPRSEHLRTQQSTAEQYITMALRLRATSQQHQLFRATLLRAEEQTSFLDVALAKSTQSKVVTAMRNYAAFCNLLGMMNRTSNRAAFQQPEPERLYITWMARTLRPGTISGYPPPVGFATSSEAGGRHLVGGAAATKRALLHRPADADA